MSSVSKHFSPPTCYSFLVRASQAFLWFLGIVLLLTAGVASAKPSSTWMPNEILFIEDNLVDRQQLIDSVGPAVEVILLDAKADGLRQIAEALERRKNIAAVHLISHGAKATLRIGSLTLDRQVLRQRGTDLARIRAALNKDVDLLVYGCEVAQGPEGQQFISLLASATGARVAASTNLTGAHDQGGDWVLESRTGVLRTAVLAFPAFRQVLPTVAGTVTIPFAHANNAFPTQKMLDGQVNTGTTDIPGITYEFYFANTGNTAVDRVTNIDLSGGTGSMLVYWNSGTSQYDPVGALIIKSQSNRLFGLSSFRIQDAQGLNATYTATGYRNNATVGAAYTFTTGGSFNPILITLPAQFKDVDEVRITSNGGIAFPSEGAKLWQEGFNSFVFIDPTTNADLAALSASAGALSPTFASATTSYSVAVSNATASTTITPTVDIPGSTIKVNGVTVASGATSSPISLNVGANTITTIVTSSGGTTKTYTTTVTRAAPVASTDANLSALSMSSGTLSPIFASATTSYTASVGNATTSLTVTPTIAEANATVTVNGVATTSGNASGAIALNVGSNTITTVVTAQDGTTTKTYTVTVTRAASSNADLSAISLSSGTLSPAFASATTSYTASVGNATTSLTVTPSVLSGTSSVTVNGVTTTSGNASGAIALNVGSNTITTVVTAQDGTTTKTYTVTVTRAASSNADLSALSLSSGTLSPAFASATTSYTASVGNATTSLTVTPTVLAGTSSITVNGVATTSGNASDTIALNVGSNTITTIVTAQDGTTTKTYTTTVTRAASSNTDLSALSLSSGTLSPVFASATTSYTASVGNATTSLTVTPTVADANATITVNGVATTSGNASGAIALNVGSNTITTVVTAQDGTTTKTYTVTVTRAASSNADLSALSLSSGTLSPVFASATIGYTASVGNATASLTVTPTVVANATVTVNGVATTSGNASGAIALNVGSNTITTVVTAQDGTTTKTYTVTVTRAASTNADLSALSLSSGTLSPVFASATSAYTASVGNATTSLTVTPTVLAGTSTITVNGVATTSGNASGAIALNVGSNTITVRVTAQDGTTTTNYTITLMRARLSQVSGTSPVGGGVITASLVGPLGCGFDRAEFIPFTGSAGSPPASNATAGYVFAQGLFDFKVGGCPDASVVTITVTYPQSFPWGAVYMKYGSTQSNTIPHWYVFPGASISGNTVTLTITDGGSGDDDLVANGSIADPGGVAVTAVAGGVTAIPTLSQWGLVLLTLLVAGVAGLSAKRIRSVKL